MQRKYPKVGDRVLIPHYIAGVRHRKNHTGILVKIDGGYHDVNPSWCDWVVELYRNEFKILGRSRWSHQKCAGFYRRYINEYWR